MFYSPPLTCFDDLLVRQCICMNKKHALYFGTDEQLVELIKSQWEDYKNKNGNYPTAQQIDANKDMVCSKTIQRRFGGLVELRKKFGYETSDFTSGSYRSNVAREVVQRALSEEIALSNWLIELFGKAPNVIIEKRYAGHKKERSDMGVYLKDKHFFVDVFNAKDKQSFLGCINFKQKKVTDITDDIYFVCTSHFSQNDINDIVAKKKNPLPQNVKVMSVTEFKRICESFKQMV